ncbi:MAG TPA: hypothetical protein VFI24_27270 [Pyrinomonadaceae bacterium]|nr:hypothetical protein [Pyrinomonadaceae bacterium]
MREQVQWTSPAPLWNVAARVEEPTLRRATLQRPTLLRFASDDFMVDLIELLANDPARLTDLVARPETWRGIVAEKPVLPAASLPAIAKNLARLRLNAQREKSPVTTSATNQLARLASDVALDQGAKSFLKFYQPAHQRYYLVSAHLVCGRAGLPDRSINAARKESVSFVIRRMLPPGAIDPNQTLPSFDPATWEEYAFVVVGKNTSWQRIPKPQGSGLLKGEEKLPLFTVNFAQDDGNNRRLFAGLVPVGKRETYIAAPQRVPPEDPQPPNAGKIADPRMMLVWSQVTEPWSRLLEIAAASKAANSSPDPNLSNGKTISPADNDRWIKGAREQIQTISWYVLLDFAKLLEQYLPNVWASLTSQPLPNPPLSPTENALLTALNATTISQSGLQNLFVSLQNGVYGPSRIALSLKAALTAINGGSTLDNRTRKQIEDGLEAAAKSYDRDSPENVWPRFLFPLADSVLDGPLPPRDPNVPALPDPLPDAIERVNHLATLVEKALRPLRNEELPETGLAGRGVFDTREGWFVIRCVFERPECGPLDLPLLSEPTRAFQMAGFFDPDAPARPIRIALPVDTSPAGLRKFDKNTAFMISDTLCGQIKRVKSIGLGDLIRTVLPWPLHQDLSVPDGGACTDKNDPTLQLGMICSFSIPIITICALLLLMIIVSLLDLIFRWMPYFFICFPLPGLKAKK